MKNRAGKSSSGNSNNDESSAGKSSEAARLKRNASLEKKDKQASDRNKLYLIPLTLVLGIAASWFYNRYLAGLVNTPLNVARVINESSYKSAENIDRFWGTYR